MGPASRRHVVETANRGMDATASLGATGRFNVTAGDSRPAGGMADSMTEIVGTTSPLMVAPIGAAPRSTALMARAWGFELTHPMVPVRAAPKYGAGTESRLGWNSRDAPVPA